jgi:hypothetical protein
LDRISDNSPIDSLENRRFYLQTYEFTMLGFLIDTEEFEVKPAIARAMLMYEFLDTKNYTKKYTNRTIEVTTASFTANGTQTTFSVGESVGFLFFVAINGLVQQRDIDYYWITGTPRITFVTAPIAGSLITILYYAGKSNVFQDSYGRLLFLSTQYFEYSGSSLVFTVNHQISDVIYVETNGLVEEDGNGFTWSGNQVTYQYTPVVGSRIGIVYLR